jgi:hypothetical protein
MVGSFVHVDDGRGKREVVCLGSRLLRSAIGETLEFEQQRTSAEVAKESSQAGRPG